MKKSNEQRSYKTALLVRFLALCAIAVAEASVGQTTKANLPEPPADGMMGFVVAALVMPLIPGKDACPHGTAPRLREAYLRTLSDMDQARLRMKENERELTNRWHAYGMGPNGTNVCSQPEMFQHTPYPGVESRYGWGLNLEGDNPKQGATCAHDKFESPDGEQGIDNQEYRATGCTLEMRGVDGNGGDALSGMKQFHASGQWTQVILLKNVDSLVRDDDVEIIYANTADRPMLDSKGNYLPGMSFTVNDTGPRHRNVLHGHILNGVLTTEPSDIKLSQTWGQGGARDIRGSRSVYHYQQGRLRLTFQPDGSLHGFVGGYRPLFDVIISPSIGGEGAAITAGIDCAAQFSALKKYADGMRDPKSGQCTAVSSAMRMVAIPAFVTDLPMDKRSASK